MFKLWSQNSHILQTSTANIKVYCGFAEKKKTLSNCSHLCHRLEVGHVTIQLQLYEEIFEDFSYKSVFILGVKKRQDFNMRV